MPSRKAQTVHIRHDRVNRTLCGRVIHDILLTITQAVWHKRRPIRGDVERLPVCKACLKALRQNTVAVYRKPDNRPPRTPRVEDWNWDHDVGQK